MITTVVCRRCPGMTMWRLPIFTWNILVTSILVLIAFPVLIAALLGLAADRHFRSHVFELHHPQMVDRLRAEAHPRRGWEPLQDSESSPHVAIGTPSTDPNDQGT